MPHAVVDLSCFGDPIAVRTQWTPLKSGRASFGRRGLVAVRNHRMEFRASVVMWLFSLALFLVGVGATARALLGLHNLLGLLVQDNLLGLLVLGLCFMYYGAGRLYFGTVPVVFDMQKGMFWKGRQLPNDVAEGMAEGRCAWLAQIHALQLVAKHDDNNCYFELNLVLQDGSRINVVGVHGGSILIRKDASTLAEFLGKPLWDALDMKIQN